MSYVREKLMTAFFSLIEPERWYLSATKLILIMGGRHSTMDSTVAFTQLARVQISAQENRERIIFPVFLMLRI